MVAPEVWMRRVAKPASRSRGCAKMGCLTAKAETAAAAAFSSSRRESMCPFIGRTGEPRRFAICVLLAQGIDCRPSDTQPRFRVGDEQPEGEQEQRDAPENVNRVNAPARAPVVHHADEDRRQPDAGAGETRSDECPPGERGKEQHDGRDDHQAFVNLRACACTTAGIAKVPRKSSEKYVG